ncbi:MAG TPA: hypothetical protein VM536_15755, partial [Chloroflexia bacterium]|nr:hypothetical protein [Chloroflexia bacterium]
MPRTRIARALILASLLIAGLLLAGAPAWAHVPSGLGAPAPARVLADQPAAPAAAISSTAAGGAWSSTATWVGGVVPTSADDVTIVDGATVTVDTAAAALSVTVGQGTSGILQYDTVAARTLTVGGNVTVATGAQLLAPATGAFTTHVLSLGGNLTNSGTINFSQNGTSSQVGITFTGSTNASFTNNPGATLNLKVGGGVILNKSTNNAA